MENIITFQNVTYIFDVEEANQSLVMRDLNLKIRKGEFLAVLGHNGSGKSTLAKHCNAIFLPTEGKVFVKGMDTADEELKYDIRQKVGMVFQNPDNQIVATTVEEDVAFGPENLGIPPEEIRRRVDHALEVVGMTEFAGHQPYKLSGGQKQRVAIAGIIAMQPECIVLDEPTAMLDPQGRIEVMRTIRELNRDFGITIVFITHFMEEAAEADRIIVVNEGEIVMDDVPREIFKRVEELRSYGLDVPQATELVYRLRNSGADIPDDVLTAEECVAALTKVLEG